MSSWSIACQISQLRVELVKLHVNYAKRENQSLLESHPANIFPMLGLIPSFLPILTAVKELLIARIYVYLQVIRVCGQ